MARAGDADTDTWGPVPLRCSLGVVRAPPARRKGRPHRKSPPAEFLSPRGLRSIAPLTDGCLDGPTGRRLGTAPDVARGSARPPPGPARSPEPGHPRPPTHRSKAPDECRPKPPPH